MSKEHTNSNGERIGRRRVLKTTGALSLVGIGGVTSVAASPNQAAVGRLMGSSRSPLSYEETRERLERMVSRNPNADDSILNDGAVPSFSDEEQLVEYVARIDNKGKLQQYYGAAAEGKESTAHANAEEKESEFEAQDDVSIQSSTPTDPASDWDFIQDNQANSVNHWGELNNNYEWYRIRDGSTERNAFRTRSASTDGTINLYDRKLNVTHDWSVSELGSEAIHDADPSTSSGGTTSVSIGFPPSATLGWTFDADGPVSQSISNSGPSVSWSNDISYFNTSWFHPGSHVVADHANCWSDQDIIAIEAEAKWGIAYRSTHTWNIYTSTC